MDRRDFDSFVERSLARLKSFVVESGKWIWGEIKAGFSWVLKISKKLVFWKKKKEGEEKEEGGEDKKEKSEGEKKED